MRSLGVRLALWYSAGVALVLVLLGAFLYVALDRYMTGQALTLLRAQAQPLQVLAAEQRNLTDLRALVNQITERPQATGIGVAVVAPGGQLLGRSQSAADQPLPKPLTEKQLRDLANGGEVETIEPSAGGRYLLLVRPLRVGGGVVAALVLSTSLVGVDATLHGFVTILAIGIGATLLIAGLVVVIVTRIGFRPLRDMTRKSQAIAAGDLSQRMDEDTSVDEVRQLAQSLNHMAERLQDAFQAQRQFAADASHELRTPLTSIAGYLDVLTMAASHGEPGTVERVISSMRSEADRMARLVRDLVSLARMDAGDQLQLERVDLTRLVGDVYEQTKAMAPKRAVNLRVNEAAWAEVDVDRMRQVLLNLADNAIKYTPADAHINFAVQTYDSTVQVLVADSGPGIPQHDLARIFDRFYRTEQSRTREKGGAGLGLAIVKKIVEAHHGTISASSPPDGGTVFSIKLPAARG
ncbi:MAG: HAMP domain-containing protein [Chloroflexi bacterium]|nr:HAMP domain-containing protein [Chloroflexota bacterium]